MTDWARDLLTALADQGDQPVDLAEAALAFAGLDRIDFDPSPARQHLSVLARDLAAHHALQPDSVATRAASLRSVICDRFGYRGDKTHYDDLRNARLPDVIERRCGLPVALGILFLHAGRAQGWPMAGLAFPGHFLIRLDGPDGRVILDPFHGGSEPSAADLRRLLRATAGEAAELKPEHYAAVPDRSILLRLQNNLKLRLVQTDRIGDALGIVDAMLLVAPEVAELWRERALMSGHEGNLVAALAAGDQFLARATDPTERHAMATLMQRLRARLH